MKQTEIKTHKRAISSEFDRKAVELLKCIVPGQVMRLDDGEGGEWVSASMDQENLAITKVERNGIIVARIVYDYETGEEKSFIY